MKQVRYDLQAISGASRRASAGFVRENEVVDFEAFVKSDKSIVKVDSPGSQTYVRSFDDHRMNLVGSGPAEWKLIEEFLTNLGPEEYRDWRFPLADAQLLVPAEITSFRDFYAFEAHVRAARMNRGLAMPPEWYEAPVFYFSNPSSLIGSGMPLRRPRETQKLDYELEIGILIGEPGCNIPVQKADDHIAGFTIINDWSMRDIQRREMAVGLGPCKSKDFATSVGPWLVTPDELEDRVLDCTRGKRYDLTMTASVNGAEYSRGNTKHIHWTFAELIAEASRNTCLLPGDLIGSGTVGTGCIAEFPDGALPWLQTGDVVTLQIDGLGVLENKIV